jgi:hypothetical protein
MPDNPHSTNPFDIAARLNALAVASEVFVSTLDRRRVASLARGMLPAKLVDYAAVSRGLNSALMGCASMRGADYGQDTHYRGADACQHSRASRYGPRLISVARDLNTACRRGMPDDKGNLDQLCAIREKLGKVINKLGYCYGKRGQAAAQMQWHRCTSRALPKFESYLAVETAAFFGLKAQAATVRFHGIGRLVDRV